MLFEKGSSFMSTQTRAPRRMRLPELAQRYAEGQKLTMLTAYDSVTAPLFEAAGVDMLLVGDSLGNVALGYSSTLPVELADMVRATGAVARSTNRAFLVADLPFGSYEQGEAEAFSAAAQLMKVGAQAVKIEGGKTRAHLVRFLVDNGIPVMGHLGYTPQAEHTLGGPRLQGRGETEARLREDAQALEDAGAFAIVLEMVPAGVAAGVTESLQIPTIGIGAGPACDGQVLVWSDMAGMTDWSPRFARRFAEIGAALQEAASQYVEAVEDGSFPGPENYHEH